MTTPPRTLEPTSTLAWLCQGHWSACVMTLLLAASGSAWLHGGADPLLLGYLLPPIAVLVAAVAGRRLLRRLSARELREEIALTGLSPAGYLVPAFLRPITRPFAQTAAGILFGHLAVLLLDLGRASGGHPGGIVVTVLLSCVAALGIAAQSMILSAAGMIRTLRFCCRERNSGRGAGAVFLMAHGIGTLVAALIPWFLAGVCITLAAASEARPRHYFTAFGQGFPAPGETAPRFMPSFLALVLGVQALWLRTQWRRLCSEYYVFDPPPGNRRGA